MLIVIFISMIIGIVLKISLVYGIISGIVFLLFTRHKKSAIVIIGIFYAYSFLFTANPVSTIDGRVVESYDYGCIIQQGLYKYFIYTDENYPLNTEIIAQCTEEEITDAGNFNAFSFKNYLASKRVFNILSLSDIKTQKHFSCKQKVIDYLDSFPFPVNSYSKQLLLGVKDEYSSDLYTLTSSLSLIHLFALSGMHLTILEKWLRKIHLNDYLILIVLGIYVLLIGNLISLWKAYLQKLIRKITDLDDLSILSLIGIIFLVSNPYIVYSSSFLFSMAMAFILLICAKLKHNQFYIYLGSVPLILWNSYTLPVLGVVYVNIGGNLIEMIFSILMLNACLIGSLSKWVKKALEIFENLLQFLNDYNLVLTFMKPSVVWIVIYYIVYIWMIMEMQVKIPAKKYLAILGCLLGICYFYVYLDPFSEVTMIDIGQGDCFLICYPFNQGNVLIDTGGSNYIDYATKRIIPYLQSIGIKKLDYVVITHDDTDHCGALDSLIENFPVQEVIHNGKDFLDFHYIDLNVSASEDENAQSLVYTLKLNGYTYLFTGDLPLEYDQEVCQQVGDIDVLKVGHHGSNTSTSSYLLSNTTPEIALISVGKDNLYGHPHEEILNRLQAYGVKIYRSDEDGMVSIKGIFNHNFIMKKKIS